MMNQQEGKTEMKVDRLECFVHVAETLNFSKSAQALHCSQPSIKDTSSPIVSSRAGDTRWLP